LFGYFAGFAVFAFGVGLKVLEGGSVFGGLNSLVHS